MRRNISVLALQELMLKLQHMTQKIQEEASVASTEKEKWYLAGEAEGLLIATNHIREYIDGGREGP